MVTIVGLGTKGGDLSADAVSALRSGARVVLRTGETAPAAGVRALGVPFETLDALYASCRNFDTLNKKLAAAVLRMAKEGDVVYCVDGSACDDRSARLVAQRARGAKVLAGCSKADAAFAAAGELSPDRCVRSAYSLAEGRPSLPLAVYDLDGELIASDAKLLLCSLFGDEADAFFVRGGKAKKIKLYETDRQGTYDDTCAVVVPAIPFLRKTRFDYDDLVHVLRLLRAPGGCPWDRAQTHESIRSNMVEEAYELVDAIDKEDDGAICEETGDVLMQGAFHSVLGEERGAFTPDDVTSEVCAKLIFRHSHIFGQDRAETEAGALSVWEKNKRTEKGQKSAEDSVFAVPAAMPACMRAQKVGKRAATAGYDFADMEEVAESVREELAELLEAAAEGDKAHVAEEAGDLLLAAVSAGRIAGADCEEALRESTNKFIERFRATAELVRADGKAMEALPKAELWAYYRRAKESLRAEGKA